MLRSLLSNPRNTSPFRAISRVYSIANGSFSTAATTSTSNDPLAVMVFGSSTDVGKTIVSAGLSIAALRSKRRVCYIKPLQTSDMDEYFIQFYTNPRANADIFVRTLHTWHHADLQDSLMEDSHSSPSHTSVHETTLPSEHELLSDLISELRTFRETAELEPPGNRKDLFSIVETAGGVLSLSPGMKLQADVYRPLRMPVVLVGDSRTGGISATISAYESLRTRGYTVHAVIMMDKGDRDRTIPNAEIVHRYLEKTYASIPGDSAEHGHHAWSLGRAPRVFTLSPTPTNRNALLHSWYEENSATFDQLFLHLEKTVSDEWQSYMDMTKSGFSHVWWPFTQHGSIDIHSRPAQFNFVESASLDYLRTFTAEEDSEGRVTGPMLRRMFDGTASVWTQMIGHGVPNMALAIAEAAGRYGHLAYGRTLHPPVVQLSRYLTEAGPGKGWAQRVFYTDGGSSAIEVAIRMAHRVYQKRKEATDSQHTKEKRWSVLTQRGSYHGCSLGALNTMTSDFFSKQHPWYDSHSHAIAVPYVSFYKQCLVIHASELRDDVVQDALSSESDISSLTDLFDLPSRHESELARAYEQYIEKTIKTIGKNGGQDEELFALLVEPLVLSVTGMRFVDPLFQKILIQTARKHGLVIIYDEITVGMYRFHAASAGVTYLQETPDISCFGKNLSGGYLPMAATLTTEEVFQAYSNSPRLSDALLHGHAYGANPIVCSSALEAIRMVENHRQTISPEQLHLVSEEACKDISKLPGVKHVMCFGNLISLQLTNSRTNRSVATQLPATSDGIGKESNSYASTVTSLLRQKGILTRTIENSIYLMTTMFTTPDDRRWIIDTLQASLKQAFYLKPKDADR